MKSLSLFGILGLFFVLSLGQTRGVKVERVYFGSGTEWAGETPVLVVCDVTEEVGEEVREVLWHREGEIVYRWALNESIQVSGVLVDRVELPSNDSDWNIKVNRMSMTIEGNFSCTARTAANLTDSGSFQFIVFYAPNATHDARLSEALCSLNATVWFPRVFPRPFVRCLMVHTETSVAHELNSTEKVGTNEDGTRSYRLDASTLFNEYPAGSYLKCHDLVYGDEIEVLTMVPKEAPNCPLPPTPRPGFNLSSEFLTPGCRRGIKVNSRAIFRCERDDLVSVGSTCEANGTWLPDLNKHQEWPTCTGNAAIGSWILLLLSYIFSRLLQI